MADPHTAPADSGNAAPPLPQDGTLSSAAQSFMGMLEPQEDNQRPEEAAPDTDDIEVSAEAPEEESAELEEGEELEASSEDESEGEDGQEYEEEVEEEEPSVYAVKIDGEDVEVSLDELISGYSRHKTFTQKTQQLAEQRREFETEQSRLGQEIAQIQGERQQYVDALQNVIAQTSKGLDQYQNINWEQLKAEDPIEYLEKKEEFREHQDTMRAHQAQQHQAIQQQQSDDVKLRQQTLSKENEMMIEKMPDWADSGKRNDLAGKLSEYAIGQGYQAEEISQLIDHRSLMVLNKARLYDEMQSSDLKAKKVKGKPRVVRTGQGVERQHSAKKRQRSKMNALKNSGSMKDAAAAFEEMMQ